MYLSTSRYEEYTDEGKDDLPVVIGVRKETVDTSYTLYTTTFGDTFARISYQVFGDPLRWWEIADINPEVAFPGEISPGTVLRIPRP